jgi:hypothetical protein
MSEWDYKPSYDTWLKEQEGDSPYGELEDAVKRSVDSQFEGLTAADFVNRRFEDY